MSGKRQREVRVTGRNAVRALFDARPDDVMRFFLVEEAVHGFGEDLRRLARSRKPYRVVPRVELDALAEGTHHEGVCAFARPRDEVTLATVLAKPGPLLLVALPGVGNPHNLGAILRVAAHFGVDAVLLEEEGPRLTAAAARIAEGGAEHVAIVRVPRLEDVLGALRAKGVELLGTSSTADGARSLYATKLGARSLFVFGAEGEGLPPSLLRAMDANLEVPGSGHVESLNVATAAAVVLGEAYRQRAAAGKTAGR